MIFKRLIIAFFFFVSIVLCGQNRNDVNSKIYYNVEDSMPVFRVDTVSQSGRPKIYYYFGKITEKVSSDIRFVGGYRALTNYFDSLYFNREDYNEDELNALFYYTILFNKKLEIKEIKIIQREGYDNLKYDYDSLIKKILFSTEGQWEKSVNVNDQQRWYLKVGLLKLK